MSKIGQALGSKYQENKAAILTREFEFNGHTFKVRVPSVKDMELIYEAFKSPDEALTDEAFKQLIAGFDGIEDEKIERTKNDLIIDGRSMRETAKNKIAIQTRIVEYFKFLVPAEGESWDGLTYQDIEDEFPLAIQLELVDEINKVISPDYKVTRSK